MSYWNYWNTLDLTKGGLAPFVIFWYTRPQSGVHIPIDCTLSKNDEFHRISEDATVTHTKTL